MSFGRGYFLVFLCAFAFTGHILCVDHYVQKVDGIALSCVQFAVMMVLSTVCAFTFETVFCYSSRGDNSVRRCKCS